MRGKWKSWGREDPPPTESAGELERVPGRAATGTATEQIHLRLVLENSAARNLRGVLERDGKRIVPHDTPGGLLTAFCVDIFTLDLQNYTGAIRICSCDAFDRL